MGFGDVKLAAVMGLYVGWLGTTYTDALGPGAVGDAHRVRRRVDHRHRCCCAARRRSKPIPFGPFLALGAVVAVLLSSRPGHRCSAAAGRV